MCLPSGGSTATVVGTVIPEPRLRILHHGELVADIPNRSLTDDAPVYHPSGWRVDRACAYGADPDRS